MTALPKDRRVDSTLTLLRDGYDFIGRRCREFGTDAFVTRLIGQSTICVSGADAARMFYDTGRMERQGAAPRWLLNTLFGNGGVQGLDGEPHRHRKDMFLRFMTPERLREQNRLVSAELRRAAQVWAQQDQVVLLDEVEQVLCRAVCDWAGVPLMPGEVEQRTRQLDDMIAGSGSVGWRHWQGRRSRRRAEAWGARLVEQVRDGRLEAPDDTPLAHLARHTDLDGRLLEPRIAAVELLNVLRPTVAIAIYVVFGALAAHRYPEARQAVIAGGDEALTAFVQEVRRFFPFFPVAAARVREPFLWQGYPFPRGRRVLLDLYGTDHDARIWDSPQLFRPERFAGPEPDAYRLIPQGGGDHAVNHRCAGEWTTIGVMKTTLAFLLKELDYDVPQQDLAVPLDRFPTLPRSRFVMTSVRSAAAAS